MPNTAYQLIEALPYPRARRRGPLTDTTGTPLHGAYQRSVAGKFRAALINNGTVLHRYNYSAPLTKGPATRHSFANLVHTLSPWQVADDAERPVTNFPATEYPYASWRAMWHEPLILDDLVRGRKPAGILAGSPADIERWVSVAAAHGLIARNVARWNNGLGEPHVVTLVAQLGPIATDEDLHWIETEYLRQIPRFKIDGALQRLRRLAGEDLRGRELTNPGNPDDLVVTGYCFGYPPATTAACIAGSHR